METDRHPAPQPARPSDTSDVPRRSSGAQSAQRRPGTGLAATPRQDALPFDDEAEHPVEFALTARGKRVVAPGALPPLAVVGAATVTRPADAGADASPERRRTKAEPAGHGWPSNDDPSDTRPSRARALHRAGLPPATIAEELDVDPLLVRAWTGHAEGPSAHGTGGGPAAVPDPATPRSPGGAGPDVRSNPEHETAFQLARSAAADRARRLLPSDAGFAAGLGLLVGTGEVDRHAVTIASMDPSIIVTIMRWMDEHLAIDPARVRVVLRVGPAAAGDLTVHRWARVSGLPRESFAVARWHDAPCRDGVQALLRVADPTVAATVAGWRDALLAPSARSPADLAF